MGGSNESEPLRLLWAGTFSIRKGAHLLLKAWQDWEPGSRVQLDVFGSNQLPDGLLKSLPEEIRFHAPVARKDIMCVMESSDLLVFPTLYDGFGMVVTEALSRGLPVLTTPCAGACSFIRHRENGLIIQEDSETELAEALKWCLNNKKLCKQMRPLAVRSAQDWQWPDYRKALIKAID
ncbi:MAG: glycosyltransferase family 4 protein [Verrucomicrobiota bacterium]